MTTYTLPDPLAARLEALAATQHRSAQAVLQDAAQWYVALVKVEHNRPPYPARPEYYAAALPALESLGSGDGDE